MWDTLEDCHASTIMAFRRWKPLLWPNFTSLPPYNVVCMKSTCRTVFQHCTGRGGRGRGKGEGGRGKRERWRGKGGEQLHSKHQSSGVKMKLPDWLYSPLFTSNESTWPDITWQESRTCCASHETRRKVLGAFFSLWSWPIPVFPFAKYRDDGGLEDTFSGWDGSTRTSYTNPRVKFVKELHLSRLCASASGSSPIARVVASDITLARRLFASFSFAIKTSLSSSAVSDS